MNGEQRFRVFNKTNYVIGVTLLNGQSPRINPNSFLVFTVNDILYIESVATRKKPFSSGLLVAVNDEGVPLTLEQLGGYPDPSAEKHLTNDEIASMLKKPMKAFETWLENIEDPVELHAVYEQAKEADLPATKLKALKKKMPNKDWLGELEEE